jgi:hypothetical protein
MALLLPQLMRRSAPGPSLESQVIDLFGTGTYAGAMYRAGLDTVFQDDAGATPGAVDQPGGRILDLSGNARHQTQTTATARPYLRESGGRWYLEFDGVDDFMVSAFAPSMLGNTVHIFMAQNTTAGAYASQVLNFCVRVGNTHYAGLGVRQSTNDVLAQVREAAAPPSTTRITAGGAVTPGVPHVLHAAVTPTAIELDLDGASQGSTALSDPVGTGGNASIGFQTAFGNGPLYGYSAYGALAIRRDLTTAQVALVRAWLASLAGVSL